jgi:hypothetical protein
MCKFRQILKLGSHFQKHGYMLVLKILFYTFVGIFLHISKFYQIGSNIFREEWDVLIILDACRYDAMCEVADEYPWIQSVNGIISVGSRSNEWQIMTFKQKWKRKIQNTVYVSGNPFTEVILGNHNFPQAPSYVPNFWPSNYDIVSIDDFYFVDNVWKNGVDISHNCVLPRTITRRAVKAHKNCTCNRLIVHYMQPHEPHIGSAHGISDPLKKLRTRQISPGDAWESYIENLRLVLDEVEILLNNIDGNRVIITSDHGEAFGEFGFYGHQIGNPIRAVRKVPWVATKAADNQSLTVGDNRSSYNNTNLEEHLSELGYR